LIKVVVEPDESFELSKREHDEEPSAQRKALAARKKAKRRERTTD